MPCGQNQRALQWSAVERKRRYSESGNHAPGQYVATSAWNYSVPSYAHSVAKLNGNCFKKYFKMLSAQVKFLFEYIMLKNKYMTVLLCRSTRFMNQNNKRYVFPIFTYSHMKIQIDNLEKKRKEAF